MFNDLSKDLKQNNEQYIKTPRKKQCIGKFENLLKPEYILY